MPCLCFNGDPIRDNPRELKPNTFAISMLEAPLNTPCTCFLAYLFPPCCAFHQRSRILNYDMSKYVCCQGYMDAPMCCFRAGSCGEQRCPRFCLAVESCCCLGPSLSSSRLWLMDTYDLRPDPCDNRIMRLANFLSCLSVLCDILSIFIRELKHLSHTVHMLADCVFYTTIGCMAGQISKEVEVRNQPYEPIPVEGVMEHEYDAKLSDPSFKAAKTGYK